MRGEDSSEDAGRVDDRHEVVRHSQRQPEGLRLDDDEVERQEGADVDEEGADGEEQKRQLGEGDEVLL